MESTLPYTIPQTEPLYLTPAQRTEVHEILAKVTLSLVSAVVEPPVSSDGRVIPLPQQAQQLPPEVATHAKILRRTKQSPENTDLGF